MKKLLAILLTLAMFATMIPVLTVGVSAEDTTISGKWTDKGNYDLSWATALKAPEGNTADATIDNVGYLTKSYTTATTFEIKDAADLAGLAMLVNAATNGSSPILKNCTFYITADIDLADHYWISIGNTFNNRFGGNLIGSKGDAVNGTGGEVAIENMYLQNNTKNTGAGFGLVGTQQGGSIKNISLENATVSCYNFRVGSFIGHGNQVTLENLTSDAKIEITSAANDNHWDSVGGIVGAVAEGNVKITNCVFTGTISNAGERSGGIVGTSEKSITIENCIVLSDEISVGTDGVDNADYVACGGIVGQTRTNDAQVTIKNCYVFANLKGSHNIGGFIGNGWQNITYTVENTQFDGTIKADSGVGGVFLGSMNSGITAISLKNCVNTGIAMAKNSNSIAFAGIGSNASADKLTVTDCYSKYTMADVTTSDISELTTGDGTVWSAREDGTPVLTIAKDMAPAKCVAKTIDSTIVKSLNAQKSTLEGVKAVRVVAQVKAEALTGAGFDFVVSYKDAETEETVTTKVNSVELTKAFEAIKVDGTETAAAEGYVWVAFVLNNITADSVTISAVANATYTDSTVYGTVGSATIALA